MCQREPVFQGRSKTARTSTRLCGGRGAAQPATMDTTPPVGISPRCLLGRKRGAAAWGSSTQANCRQSSRCSQRRSPAFETIATKPFEFYWPRVVVT